MTGGQTRLWRITKMGDRYLRKLLVIGACATPAKLTRRSSLGNSDAAPVWASAKRGEAMRRSFH
jgi:hypothetical protein